MRSLPLSQGMYALVDDEDYEYLNNWKWYAKRSRNVFYAARNDYSNGHIAFVMHRVILGLTDPEIITDHIDHNGLNNQRSNLRIATKSENRINSRPRVGTASKYTGVCYQAKIRKWMVRLHKSGVKKYLGVFSTEVEAAEAYNKEAVKLFGEFANLNVI